MTVHLFFAGRPYLVDAAAAAQTEACHGALMEFLDFEKEDSIDLPEKYLLGVAFSSQPSHQLLSDIWVNIK